VERHVVARLVHVLHAGAGVDPLGLDHGLVHVRVDGVDRHPEPLGDRGHGPAHVAVGVQPDLLAPQLRAGLAGVAAAGQLQHQAEHQFAHRVGVLARRVHDHHALRRRRLQVDVVVPRAGADHQLEFLPRLQDLGRHQVAADDEGVDVRHRLVEVGDVLVVLQQDHFVAGPFQDVGDPRDRHLGERLFRGHQHLSRHGILQSW